MVVRTAVAEAAAAGPMALQVGTMAVVRKEVAAVAALVKVVVNTEAAGATVVEMGGVREKVTAEPEVAKTVEAMGSVRVAMGGGHGVGGGGGDAGGGGGACG